MVGLVFLVVFALAGIIKYPDKISARGKLTSTSPPLAHYSKIPGVIDSLYVSDGDQINKNDPLVYIQII